MRLLTISNVLSLLRAPLALLFLVDNVVVRVVVLAVAALTDYFDGFIARRSGTTTQLGAVLDPVMDKIFMFFVLCVLIVENQLTLGNGLAMITRDFALFGFVAFLLLTGGWRGHQAAAVWWGKVVTAAQYVVLLLIVLGVVIPNPIFWLFILFGLFYLGELIVAYRRG